MTINEPIFGFILYLAFVSFLLAQLFSGEMHGRGGYISRKRSPVNYWLAFSLEAIVFVIIPLLVLLRAPDKLFTNIKDYKYIIVIFGWIILVIIIWYKTKTKRSDAVDNEDAEDSDTPDWIKSFKDRWE